MTPSPDSRRVVITGAGIITSMGVGWQENADGFRAGRLAFSPVTLFDTSRQRVHTAGEIQLPPRLPPHALSARRTRFLDRATILLLHAASEAWHQAAWGAVERASPIPLCLGTSAGAMALGEAYYRGTHEKPLRRSAHPRRILNYQTHRQAIHLADALDFEGPVTLISNACASGANAIGHAFQLIRRGECERAFAGGYDALAHLVFAGFDSLQALTPSGPPRPFDAHRDGLALGEGAAMLALESLASARARGANIMAEIVGYGVSTDIHHLTQPHPEGDAALRSMEMACREAGLRPADIDYLNSHGTGTPLNDVAEGRAIQRWAGGDVGKIKVSSTKSGIGHLLGGAGAVETVISLMALREQFLPPTTTVETPDPVCTFDLVRQPREARVRRVLTNSFGFGGANASLILATCDDSRVQITGTTFPGQKGICIAGWGAVSPAGWSAADLVSPKNVAPIEFVTRPGRERPVPVRRVPVPVEKFPFLRDPRLRRASPIGRFATAAALEAIGNKKLDAIRTGEWRLGVIYCLLNGSINYSGRFYGEVLADPALASPILFPETVYNAPASHLSALLGSTGLNYTLVGDSAQFADGLLAARRWLTDDLCDGVVVVGAEEFDWLSAEAFQLFAPDTIFAEGAGALYFERGESEDVAIIGPERYTARRDKAQTLAGLAARIPMQQGLIGDPTLFDRKNGDPVFDASESAAWASFAGPRESISARLGEAGGAAVAWQCVLAAASGKPAVVSAAGENEQAATVVFRDAL